MVRASGEGAQRPPFPSVSFSVDGPIQSVGTTLSRKELSSIKAYCSNLSAAHDVVVSTTTQQARFLAVGGAPTSSRGSLSIAWGGSLPASFDVLTAVPITQAAVDGEVVAARVAYAIGGKIRWCREKELYLTNTRFERSSWGSDKAIHGAPHLATARRRGQERADNKRHTHATIMLQRHQNLSEVCFKKESNP